MFKNPHNWPCLCSSDVILIGWIINHLEKANSQYHLSFVASIKADGSFFLLDVLSIPHNVTAKKWLEHQGVMDPILSAAWITFGTQSDPEGSTNPVISALIFLDDLTFEGTQYFIEFVFHATENGIANKQLFLSSFDKQRKQLFRLR